MVADARAPPVVTSIDVAGRLIDRRGQGGTVIRHHGQRHRDTAAGPHQRRDRMRVGTSRSRPAGQAHPASRIVIPRRHDRDHGAAVDRQPWVGWRPAASPDVVAPPAGAPVPATQFPRGNPVPPRGCGAPAHMPRSRRTKSPRAGGVLLQQDRVCARRHHAAGEQPDRLAGADRPRERVPGRRLAQPPATARRARHPPHAARSHPSPTRRSAAGSTGPAPAPPAPGPMPPPTRRVRCPDGRSGRQDARASLVDAQA